jgi:hypothetical protein
MKSLNYFKENFGGVRKAEMGVHLTLNHEFRCFCPSWNAFDQKTHRASAGVLKMRFAYRATGMFLL